MRRTARALTVLAGNSDLANFGPYAAGDQLQAVHLSIGTTLGEIFITIGFASRVLALADFDGQAQAIGEETIVTDSNTAAQLIFPVYQDLGEYRFVAVRIRNASGGDVKCGVYLRMWFGRRG